MVLTKERSILIRSTGSSRRFASDEWPVPKSSIANVTPIARKDSSALAAPARSASSAALGELELEHRRVDAVHGDEVTDTAGKPWVLEIASANVHRDSQGQSAVGPLRALSERLAEHVRRQRLHELGLLGEGEEFAGKHQSETRVRPSDECLDADDLTTSQLDLGLVVEHELVVLDRVLEFAEHEQPRLPRPRRFAQLDRPARDLRFVHRLVRMLQQTVDVVAVVGVDRESGADPDLERDTRNRQRALELALDLVDRRTRGRHVLDVTEQHRELVTAEPSRDVDAATGATETCRDLLQHPVADEMTQLVVDRLETVEIQDGDREGVALAVRTVVRVANLVEELASVGEVGQRVVRRFVLTSQRELRGAIHVPHDDHEEWKQHRSAGRGDSEHGRQRQQHAVRRKICGRAAPDDRPHAATFVERDRHARKHDVHAECHHRGGEHDERVKYRDAVSHDEDAAIRVAREPTTPPRVTGPAAQH